MASDLTYTEKLFSTYDTHSSYVIFRLVTPSAAQPRAGDLLEGDLSGVGVRMIHDTSRGGQAVTVEVVQHADTIRPIIPKLVQLGCWSAPHR